MAQLNNNQVCDLLIDAYKQSTGQTEVSELDLSSFVDTGSDDSIIGSKEQFTKALINVVTKNWFTDSSYRSEYNDPFYQDESQFGAITQMISVEVPDVQESHAWQDFISGTSTVGEYTVFIPIVHNQFYGKTNSFELPITITYEQWDTAFRSEDEIKNFVSYILMVVDNKLTQHMEDLNNLNRDNFIAELYNYQQSEDATGVHVINLIELYNSNRPASGGVYTVEDFFSSKDCLNFARSQMLLYSKYMRKQSTLFNTEGLVRFTPKERLVVQMLSYFEAAMDSVALSNTYHNDVVELPKYESIPYWQGFSDTNPTFEDVSTIKVKTGSDGTSTTIDGVVAFMCDQWAIMHTIKKHRIASKTFDPEALQMYFYQFRDAYMNNLTLNALVFTVQDVTPPDDPVDPDNQ